MAPRAKRARVLAAGLGGALALAPGGAAVAQDAAGAPPRDAGALVCIAVGYDVFVRNTGAAPVPAGTGIAWAVPFARVAGEHRFDAPLAPGSQVVLAGAMGPYFTNAEAPCTLAITTDALPAHDSGAAPAPGPGATAVLACEAVRYDIFVRNRGAAPVPAGTEVAWSVPFARVAGRHRLEAPLAPGGQIVLAGRLGSDYSEPNNACEIAAP